MRTVWDIVKTPLITEKALTLKEQSADGKQLLTFRVDVNATKPEIKSAVEKIFNVRVSTVRTVNYAGKRTSARGRGKITGRKPSWKKAYVTLFTGEKPFDYNEAV